MNETIYDLLQQADNMVSLGHNYVKIVRPFPEGILSGYAVKRGYKTTLEDDLNNSTILSSLNYGLIHNFAQGLMQSGDLEIIKSIPGESLNHYFDTKDGTLSTASYSKKLKTIAQLPQETFDNFAEKLSYARKMHMGGDLNRGNVIFDFDNKTLNLIDVAKDKDRWREITLQGCTRLFGPYGKRKQYGLDDVIEQTQWLNMINDKLAIACAKHHIPEHLMSEDKTTHWIDVVRRSSPRTLSLSATAEELSNMLRTVECDNGIIK